VRSGCRGSISFISSMKSFQSPSTSRCSYQLIHERRSIEVIGHDLG
jgi:hypothetical protein